MPFPPGYRPTPRGALLKKAIADARWVVEYAESTLHAANASIVDGLAGGLDYAVLEEAADTVIEARDELAEGSEIIDQVSADVYDPEQEAEHGGYPGTVSERDRADLEQGREHAWTAHLSAGAVIDQLDAATEEQRRRSLVGYFD